MYYLWKSSSDMDRLNKKYGSWSSVSLTWRSWQQRTKVTYRKEKRTLFFTFHVIFHTHPFVNWICRKLELDGDTDIWFSGKKNNRKETNKPQNKHFRVQQPKTNINNDVSPLHLTYQPIPGKQWPDVYLHAHNLWVCYTYYVFLFPLNRVADFIFDMHRIFQN